MTGQLSDDAGQAPAPLTVPRRHEHPAATFDRSSRSDLRLRRLDEMELLARWSCGFDELGWFVQSA